MSREELNEEHVVFGVCSTEHKHKTSVFPLVDWKLLIKASCMQDQSMSTGVMNSGNLAKVTVIFKE